MWPATAAPSLISSAPLEDHSSLNPLILANTHNPSLRIFFFLVHARHGSADLFHEDTLFQLKTYIKGGGGEGGLHRNYISPKVQSTTQRNPKPALQAAIKIATKKSIITQSVLQKTRLEIPKEGEKCARKEMVFECMNVSPERH